LIVLELFTVPISVDVIFRPFALLVPATPLMVPELFKVVVEFPEPPKLTPCTKLVSP